MRGFNSPSNTISYLNVRVCVSSILIDVMPRIKSIGYLTVPERNQSPSLFNIPNSKENRLELGYPTLLSRASFSVAYHLSSMVETHLTLFPPRKGIPRGISCERLRLQRSKFKVHLLTACPPDFMVHIYVNI